MPKKDSEPGVPDRIGYAIGLVIASAFAVSVLIAIAAGVWALLRWVF